jgi:hypothetical protein
MECLKMGMPVVLSPQDALRSLYTNAAILTPEPAENHMSFFTDAVVGVLQRHLEDAYRSSVGKSLAERHTYENAAESLERIILRHLPERAQAA